MDRADALVVEPQPRDHAGTEVLHHDVGAPQQLAQRSDVVRVLQIQREALLAPVDGVKERRISADLGIAEVESPAEVAAVRALDLDDPRPQVLEP